MMEFIKRLLKCFKNNKVATIATSENSLNSLNSLENTQVTRISTTNSLNNNIPKDIYPLSEVYEQSSEEFNDENHAIKVVDKIIRQQKKIFNDILNEKIKLDKHVYVILKTNDENFTDALKSIKDKDTKDKCI